MAKVGSSGIKLYGHILLVWFQICRNSHMDVQISICRVKISICSGMGVRIRR